MHTQTCRTLCCSCVSYMYILVPSQVLSYPCPYIHTLTPSHNTHPLYILTQHNRVEDQLLGENALLVDLDSLGALPQPKKTGPSPSNPFGASTSTSSVTQNPFDANKPPAPTLHQLATANKGYNSSGKNVYMHNVYTSPCLYPGLECQPALFLFVGENGIVYTNVEHFQCGCSKVIPKIHVWHQLVDYQFLVGFPHGFSAIEFITIIAYE